jgi:hypothetical protein
VRVKLLLVFTLFLILITGSANAIDWRVGQRVTLVGPDQDTYYNRSYVVPKFQFSLAKESELELNGELLAYSDHNLSDDSAQIKELFLSWSQGFYTIGVGAKTYAFSETFGVNIMDVLTPRNYESYILDDSFWSTQSVLAADLNLFFDRLTAHFILIPKAKKAEFPEYGAPYDLRSQVGTRSLTLPKYRWVDDGEAAIRLGYLFDSGVDATLLLATHMGRQLSLVVNQDLALEWQNERVTTIGSTFNYSVGDWVYRGDLLYTPSDLYPNGLLSVKKGKHLQSILGGDWSGSRGKFVGLQHHYDSIDNNHWVSFLYRHLLLSDRLELEAMLFSGITSDDLWIRPRVSWLGDNYSLRLQYDLLDGSEANSPMRYFRRGDRIVGSAEYFF